ncbi:MAG TPA: HPF/RaiA family ribosome-associated protein [Solirubrobacteraceae bacterium]|nr:HPF/RaiA family ribosome-associated protein [Solirubrobacteraceae bacterium]
MAETEAPIDISVPKGFPQSRKAEVRRRLEKLGRFTDEPLLGVRLTLRNPASHSRSAKWMADASAVLNGRLLAAHATGPEPVAATDAAVERLGRQLRRTAGAEVARRNEPRGIAKALEDLAADVHDRPVARLKPPELRDLIRTRTWAPGPEGMFDAVADLLDLDLHFLLFTHVRTGEDVVVYRRDDGRLGLLHPPRSPLAGENDILAAEPSRYPDPITLERGRGEMDVLNHRFLYFIDAADGRGKVIYLRHDGDYGLVVPE